MCRSVEKELRVLLVAAKSIVGLLNLLKLTKKMYAAE